MTVLEFLGAIGAIAGVLGVGIFIAYRWLVKLMRDDRRYMEDRLTQIIEGYKEAMTHNSEATIKHAQVLTELITWLKARNGGE